MIPPTAGWSRIERQATLAMDTPCRSATSFDARSSS